MKVELQDNFEGRTVTATFSVSDLEMMSRRDLEWDALSPTDILFKTYILSLRVEKKKGKACIQKIVR